MIQITGVLSRGMVVYFRRNNHLSKLQVYKENIEFEINILDKYLMQVSHDSTIWNDIKQMMSKTNQFPTPNVLRYWFDPTEKVYRKGES